MTERTIFIIIFLSIFFCVLSFNCAYMQREFSEEDIRIRAKEIHDNIITIDTHVDIGFDFATPEVNPGMRLEKRKVDLVKMKEGGIDGAFFVVYVPQKKLTEESYKEAYDQAMIKFNAIRRMCGELNPDKVELALSTSDVYRIVKTGKRIAVIGVENGFPVGSDISRVKEFFDLGARYMSLTHMGYNQLGDSSDPLNEIPAKKYGGLTEFGKRVIREMNRLGMIVDVTHISIDSFCDVIEISKAPIIASHSGCRALCDVPRNLTDDQLKALKKKGGVIQIVAFGGYLRRPTDEITIKDFIDHIDYAVNLIGIDHVGIGADFDGGGGIPGYNDASEALNVTIELVRRGFSKKDIEKIWGGNLLRVWRDVEKVAEKL